MPRAARIVDAHCCPAHCERPIVPPASLDVWIGGRPAARLGDFIACWPPNVIIEGSESVHINGRPAARRGDASAHGGRIKEGEPTVLIGQSSSQAKRARLAQRQALIANARASSIASPSLLAAADRLEFNNKAVEHARLSESVYGACCAPVGWTRLTGDDLPEALRDERIWSDDESGFYAALYRSDDGEIVLAFRGTENGRDWRKANIPQGLGLESEQYTAANTLARAVQRAYGPGVRTTGHSLGGGLATLASVSTGMLATVFNPAALHRKTAARVGADVAAADSQVDAVIVRGEILTTAQDYTPLPDARGRRHYVQAGDSMLGAAIKGARMGSTVGSMVGPKGRVAGAVVGAAVAVGMESYDRHGMDHVIEGIEAQKSADIETLQRAPWE
ncbi:MAG TPA: PAAR domain-containing protein [Nannocystaceae bacterium]|nr:PAAR domain-containing protein [Nannocystaceae bacterium]